MKSQQTRNGVCGFHSLTISAGPDARCVEMWSGRPLQVDGQSDMAGSGAGEETGHCKGLLERDGLLLVRPELGFRPRAQASTVVLGDRR
jgi:hypothetical protein